MHRYLFLFAVAISPAMADIATVICDGVTTEGTSSASCSNGGGSASVATGQPFSMGYPMSPMGVYVPPGGPYLDVTATGNASASYAGAVMVEGDLPAEGFFELLFEVSGSTSLTVDGSSISTQSEFPFTGIGAFTSGEIPPILIGADASNGSVELEGVAFYNISSQLIEPQYILVDDTAISTPEPSGLLLTGAGLLLMLASRRVPWLRIH